MKKIEAILWDQDGLLVDTERLYFLSNREALRREGVPLSRERYVALFLRSNHGMHAIRAEQGWDVPKMERVRAARNRLYEQYLRTRIRPLPWARTVLRRLSRRFRMVMVTSSYRRHVKMIEKKAGLLKYMDFIVAEGDFVNSKPDPEPYLVAVRRLGLKASQCVAVEDSERGLIAARKAGVRCVVIPNALTRDCRFRGAWRVLDSLRDLPQLLESSAGHRSDKTKPRA